MVPHAILDQFTLHNQYTICMVPNNMGLIQYKDLILPLLEISLWRYKTILQPSYFHNEISYTGKTTSLYWIGALVIQGAMLKIRTICHARDLWKLGFVTSCIYYAHKTCE